MVESGLDSCGPRYRLVAGFCEDGNEHLCPVKRMESLSREHYLPSEGLRCMAFVIFRVFLSQSHFSCDNTQVVREEEILFKKICYAEWFHYAL